MENKSSRNKTLKVSEEDIKFYSEKLLLADNVSSSNYINKTILGNTLAILEKLPDEFADLIIIDPPYNLTKDFNKIKFKSISNSQYIEYLTTWLPKVCKKLNSTGSLYLCGDWKCTAALQTVLAKELTILNRITWQREKGRGAKSNWKNSMEDIWFAVKNPKKYTFNINAVKIKRKVLAPYRINGLPKDWEESDKGKFRETYPSNFWDDITVPFWSMLENTIHPTQKPEKLIAKLILASSKEGDIVFDPFLGSGTTSVVAKKLNRKYCGIEIDKEYAVLAEKRLELASSNKKIQGYEDGVFWERNTK